jgi:hypothetical protein
MSDSIPDFVFEVVNDMLVEKMSRSSGTAVLKQDDIAKAVRQHPEYKQLKPRPDIYDKHWMDFEDHYRKAGWVVEYDRPAYNESYPPTFTFRVRA